MHKKLFCRVIAIILLFTIGTPAKALSQTKTSVPLEGITLNNEAMVIGVNSYSTLKATFDPSNATDKSLIWESSNEDIATVDSYGNVTGKAVGTATITVSSKTDENISAACEVTVASISLAPTKRGLVVENSFDLTVSVEPSSLESEVEWSSSNPLVADVNDGNVTGIKAGTTTISATIKDSKVSANVTVKVYDTEQKLTAISFSNISMEVHEGKNVAIMYELNPQYTTQPELTWTSSDQGIATVNEKGIVTGIREGEVIITAMSTANNEIDNRLNVRVLPTIQVSDIEGIPSTLELPMDYGTKVISPKITPEDATFPELKVWSSNSKIVRVSMQTTPIGAYIYNITPQRIKGPEPQTATVTFQSVDNPDIKKECEVTVTFVPTLVEEVKFPKNSATVTQGDKYTLEATVSPSDATNKELKWTISNEELASIEVDPENNAKVIITALNPTEKDKPVIITATTTDGSFEVNEEGEKSPIKAEFELTINKKIIKITDIKIEVPEECANEKGSMVLTFKDGFADYQTKGQLTAKLTPENTTQTEIVWTSSNTSVATVENDGLVTAIAGGTATITAKSKENRSIYATCKVEVLTPVEKIEIPLKGDYLSIKEGKTATVTANVIPSSASNKKVIWSSDNETIATIDERGLITAKKVGETTIKATADDKSGVESSIRVVVRSSDEIDVNRITITPSSATLYQYMTKQLEATVSPQNATNKELKWESSDQNIATVDNKGLVTGVAGGKVTIKAYSVSDPSISASASITINPILRQIEVIDFPQAKNEIEVGTTYTLPVYIYPENATNRNLIWESSDPEVATVSETGVVKALKAADEVTITAKAQDGSNVKAEITLKIFEPEKPTTNQITLNETEVNLEEGETFQLEAEVYLITSGVSKDLTWSSENPDIARVSSTGKITAVREGETIIYAELKEHPEINAQCKVTVSEKVILINSISIYPRSLKLEMGETYRLSYSYYPSYATNPVFYWSTNNGSVATIIDGTVYANSIGTATIYLEAMDGSNVSATCDVTVTQASGINGVNGDEVKVKVDGNSINIEGVADATIEVFNLSGALIYSGTEPKVDNLAAGLYIVRIGSYSTKVAVK